MSIRPFPALLAAAALLGFAGLARLSPASAAGAIQFDSGTRYTLTRAPANLATADLDGDGHVDLVAGSDGALHVLYNAGDGTLESPVEFPIAPSIADGEVVIADMNGDGRPDLVSAVRAQSHIAVLFNLGNRLFSAASTSPSAQTPQGVSVADYNKDGALDMAVSNNFAHTLSVFLNTGNGTFHPRVDYAAGTNPARLVSLDFNGDGNLDLALANYVSSNIQLYMGNGSGAFTAGSSFPAGYMAHSIAPADYNRDGIVDLAVTNVFPHTLSVLIGRANTTFENRVVYQANTYPHVLAAADFDHDGWTDLVMSNNYTSYFTLLRNQGNGSFAAAQSFQSGLENNRTIAIADFDEDGRMDVALASENVKQVGIFRNLTSVGSPAAPTAFTATSTTQSAVSLQWNDNSASEADFLLERRTGTGTFTPLAQLPANTTTYQDLTVQGGTTYTYRLFARNQSGVSNPATLTLTTPRPIPLAPTNLLVQAVEPNSLTITWVDQSEVEAGFLLERRSGLSEWVEVALVGANQTSYTDAPLQANTLCTYRLRATNESGDSATLTAEGLTLPAPPHHLEATVVSQIRVDLRWQNGLSAGTRVERSVDNGQSFQALGTVERNVVQYSDQTASAITAYLYRVRGTNASGQSAPSAAVAVTTLPNPPGAPSSLSATALSTGSVRLFWTDAGSTETGYAVEHRNAGTWVTVGQTGPDETSFLHTGTVPNALHAYRVRAVNSGGASAPTNEAEALTYPSLPGGFSVAVAASTQLTLSWADSNPTPAATEVERSRDGVTFLPLVTVPAGTVTHADVGLTPSTSYTYRIRSQNATGASAWSTEITRTTAATLPAAPSGLAIVLRGRDFLALEWTDNSTDETAFLIEHQAANGSFTSIGSVPPNQRQFRHQGLAPGSQHTYRVKAVNSVGASSSDLVTGTTLPNPPAPPASLQAQAVAEGTLQLSWSTLPAGTSLWIERSIASAPFQLAATLEAGSTSWQDTGLPEVTSVAYRLTAFNEGGEALPVTAAATTLPLTPGGLTSASAAGAVELIWTDRSQAETGYRVESSNGSGGFTLLAVLPAGTTRALLADADLVNAATYRVYATASSGLSIPAETTGDALDATSGAKFQLSKRVLDLGTGTTAKPKSAKLTITNKGKKAGWVTLHTPSSPFSLVTTVVTRQIRAGKSFTLSVRLQSVPGTYRGTLRLTSTDPRLAQADVVLKGKVKR